MLLFSALSVFASCDSFFSVASVSLISLVLATTLSRLDLQVFRPAMAIDWPIGSCHPRRLHNYAQLELSWGTWCSGITPTQHAGGPGLNPQRVHVLHIWNSSMKMLVYHVHGVDQIYSGVCGLFVSCMCSICNVVPLTYDCIDLSSAHVV